MPESSLKACCAGLDVFFCDVIVFRRWRAASETGSGRTTADTIGSCLVFCLALYFASTRGRRSVLWCCLLSVNSWSQVVAGPGRLDDP